MKCAIGNRTFATKKAAVAEIRRVLHQTPLGEQLAGEEKELIAALFALHPGAADEIKRKGIALGFTVQEHDYHGTRTRGFYALHLRSVTPFSYMTCLDPRRHVPNPIAVMRAAIKAGQYRAKQAYFRFRSDAECPRCHTTMAFRDAHVDHEPPKFRDIAAAYIAQHGEPKCESSYLGDKFCDPQEWDRWIAFHDARAKLTVVCATCNYAAERKSQAQAAE